MIDIVLAYQQNLIMNEKQNRKSIAIREIVILIQNIKNNQFDSIIINEN